jgi:hypothetical protein
MTAALAGKHHRTETVLRKHSFDSRLSGNDEGFQPALPFLLPATIPAQPFTGVSGSAPTGQRRAAYSA